jgi:hypothetical protein
MMNNKDCATNQTTSYNTNNVLAAGILVRRNSDGVIGTIERFGHRFGNGSKAYNAYYVRWSDGNLGYPSEGDFTMIEQ